MALILSMRCCCQYIDKTAYTTQPEHYQTMNKLPSTRTRHPVSTHGSCVPSPRTPRRQPEIKHEHGIFVSAKPINVKSTCSGGMFLCLGGCEGDAHSDLAVVRVVREDDAVLRRVQLVRAVL
jgi:hypothetical protein